MNLEQFIDALAAIAVRKEVSIPFQLQIHGQLVDVINSLGGAQEATEYFRKVADAQPPTIGEDADKQKEGEEL